MREHEMLQHAAAYFKTNYPGLGPEAVVAFMSILYKDHAVVADVASTLGVDEAVAGQYLVPLLDAGGAGLISMKAAAGGGNSVHLTGRGMNAKSAIEDAINSS